MSRRGLVAGLTVAALGVVGAVGWGFWHERESSSSATRAATGVTLSATGVERAPRPEVATLAWGPSVIDYARAVAAARELPLEVAAGHVIVAAVSSPDPAQAATLVRDEYLAGVILMGGSIVDADQVRKLAAAVQSAAAEDGRTWPAIVSTDQEGGPVARLGGIVPELPAFMAAGSVADKDEVTATYRAAAQSMRALGITVDWAPDADVTVGVADPVIRVRSAGEDPARVADTVVAATHGFVDGGVVPALKHFPGHGSVTTDSHEALPVQSATVAQLENADLVPFADAIDAGAPAVMMGHIAVAEWGGGPSTLNPKAYEYLRGALGFTGVAVTDALNMRAVTDRYPAGEAGVVALAAGADLLLLPRDPAGARDAIVAAVDSGALSRDRLDEAVARVSLMMEWQEEMATAADTAPSDPSIGEGYARAFAASAATVSAPTCGGPYVGSTVTISGGWPVERQALADALAGYDISTGGGTTILLLGTATSSGDADVVVAMDGPWGLVDSRASVYVGLYGRSAESLAGLADVLAGAVAPTGQWAIPGMPEACGAS